MKTDKELKSEIYKNSLMLFDEKIEKGFTTEQAMGEMVHFYGACLDSLKEFSKVTLN